MHSSWGSVPGAKQRLTWTGISLFAFVFALFLLVIVSGWYDAFSAISRLSLWGVVILCGLAIAHYAIRAIRWHFLVRTDGVNTTAGQNIRHFFGGFAMLPTPGRVGELVRLRWLRLETGRSVGSLVPIVLADRVIELAAIVGLIAMALVFANLETAAVWWLLGATTSVIFVLCHPVLLERFLLGSWRIIGRRKPRTFVKLRRIIRRIGPFVSMSVFVPLLVIGIFGWALEGVAFWLLLDWLDVPLPLSTATAIFLAAVLSGAISGLPGGLGGTEAAMVTLLVLQDIPVDVAVVATAIIRTTTLWLAIFIGMIVFPRAELRAVAAGAK